MTEEVKIVHLADAPEYMEEVLPLAVAGVGQGRTDIPWKRLFTAPGMRASGIRSRRCWWQSWRDVR